MYVLWLSQHWANVCCDACNDQLRALFLFSLFVLANDNKIVISLTWPVECPGKRSLLTMFFYVAYTCSSDNRCWPNLLGEYRDLWSNIGSVCRPYLQTYILFYGRPCRQHLGFQGRIQLFTDGGGGLKLEEGTLPYDVGGLLSCIISKAY